MQPVATSGRGGVRTQADFPKRHQPTDALRDMPARKRRSCDVLDIGLEAQLIETLTTGKLAPPGWNALQERSKRCGGLRSGAAGHFLFLSCTQGQSHLVEAIRGREKGRHLCLAALAWLRLRSTRQFDNTNANDS